MANHLCLLFCLCLSVILVNCGINKVDFKNDPNLRRSKRGYGYGTGYSNYNNNYNQDQDNYNYNSYSNQYRGSPYQHSPNYNQKYDDDLRLSQQYSKNPFLNHALSNDGNIYSSNNNQYSIDQNQYPNYQNHYSNDQNKYTNTQNSNSYAKDPNLSGQKQSHNSYISHYGYGQSQYPTEENIDTSYNQNISDPELNVTNTDHQRNTIDLSNNIFFNGVFRNLKNQGTSTTQVPNNNMFEVIEPTVPNKNAEEVFNPTPASNNYIVETFKPTPATNYNMEEVYNPTPASNNNIKHTFTSPTLPNINIFEENTTVPNNFSIEANTLTPVPNNNTIATTTTTPVPTSNINEPSEADYDIRIDVLEANKDDSDIVENNLFILRSSTAPLVTTSTNSDKVNTLATTAKSKETTPNVEVKNGNVPVHSEDHKERTTPISNSDLETIFGPAPSNFELKPAVSFDEGTFLIHDTLNKDKVERTTLPALQPVFSESRSNIPVFAATCQTPSGGLGSCISILNCTKYLELLKSAKTNPKARQELINAQCGTEGRVPKVCCPTSSNLENGENSGGFIREAVPRPILQLPASPQCGGANFKFSRVVGGIPATLGELPWMALLGYHGKRTPQPRWLCGGSLITARHVLTAAHCVYNYENDLYQVRLGELDLSSDTEGPAPIDIPIKQQIKHENYDHVTHKNDIALLELDHDVQFTAEIKPICMPKDSDLRSKTFERYRPIVAGWGDTRYRGPSSSQLLMVQLPVSTKASCQSSYQPFRNQITIDDTMLCAGLPQGGQDACQGDSGGPLAQPILRNGATVWYQIGVVSYGKKCAEPNMPGVYTRVTEFIPWIEEKISG